MPAPRGAEAGLVLPAVFAGVVHAHRARVSVIDVTSCDQDLAIHHGAGVAAPRHLQRGLHLPLVSCRHVALDRGEAALGVAASHRKEEPIEHVQAEVGAPLIHVRQVNPAIETRVISERIQKRR